MDLTFLFTIFIFISCTLVAECRDFYELLGVDRQASAKEIRKAFKKLALTMHPDKNRGDEEAHDKFLELNRAYEVLKDDETRKVYDRHGEDGLKEKPSHGGGYHSWNYYNQEFGIYDEDPEIITLSHSDFEASVEGSGDMWFINYYSPHCSHCHDLAPAWRELAREMVGVVRVGAVNCEDDFMICRKQGVRSYPSLYLYPGGEKYTGVRDKEHMVNFIMSKVKSRVVHLTHATFEATCSSKTDLPWLIRFCFSHSSECLEHSSLLKIAAMLNELVHVGSMECGGGGAGEGGCGGGGSGEGGCGGVVEREGLFFFPRSAVKKGMGKEIASYDAREVAENVLEMLPDVPLLSVQELEEAIASGKPWLLHFVDGPFKDLDLRKLPSLVDSAQVGRVDCSAVEGMCKNLLHIHKLPSFILFKRDSKHEYHYGRHTAHDVAAFTKESLSSLSTSLHPSNFPSLTDPSQLWIIDFFAPWCPPCMRLLPEFRKASRSVGFKVNFGTVDCTSQQELCNKHNVQSYPTTIFFNQSKPHNYHGHHASQDIVEFIEDVLNPPVISLDAESFIVLVELREAEALWLVDFFAPWCGPCQQLAPEWRKLAKLLKDVKNLRVAQIDCQQHQATCQKAAVNSYPSIRFYNGNSYTGYNGWHRDAHSLRAWTFSLLPSKAYNLDMQVFTYKVIGSTKAWVIDFYAPWCGPCQNFAPEFELVATKLKGRVRAGKVNCDEQQALCQRASVTSLPSVLYYTADAVGFRGKLIDSQNAQYIINTIEDLLSKERPGKTRIEL